MRLSCNPGVGNEGSGFERKVWTHHKQPTPTATIGLLQQHVFTFHFLFCRSWNTSLFLLDTNDVCKQVQTWQCCYHLISNVQVCKHAS